MDQLDRRTKLLIVGGVCLLLVIGIIVLAVSCSAARKREPESTPVVDINPIPESTPAPTQSLAPRYAQPYAGGGNGSNASHSLPCPHAGSSCAHS